MENNKSLRIRTNVGQDQYVTVNLTQEYDVLEILSMKIDQRGTYRYNVGDYGVVVGRVLANNGFGVPNAKLSLFIEKNDTNDIVKELLYPYDTINGKDRDGRRYNLLPDLQKDDCHRVVGTFPNKRLMLDDTSVLEIFDEYYKYTTRTNEAGDYMFFGIPTGSYTLHMDLDISDCGKLSQRPRDFIYKGYTIEQFENPNQFKVDTELSTLSQVFSQDTTVDIKPFWGDAKEGTQIGITRKDIDVAFKFEPTCVFMGSIVTDTPNEGISRKCVPSKRMGEMSEMVTGPGTIEIIRKNIDNTVSELQIKGTQLIDGNGVWCFQIPMNLDYMMTDEYGNMVPTDNPEKGIPTRCEVRFRLSLDETNPDAVSYHRGKVLVPHNPNNENEIDYNFGSRTKDHSFKSLMWNNVYTIKSFIPRFQRARNILTDRFTGIKKVNVHGVNNPIPYNNIRIRIPFMFWLMCNIIKLMVRIVKVINTLKRGLMNIIGNLGFTTPYSYISNEICPDLEYWYFAPGMKVTPKTAKNNRTCRQWENESVCNTYKEIVADLGVDDDQTFQEQIYGWVDTLNDGGDVSYEYAFVDPNNNDETLEVADVFTENELKIELGITGETTSGSKEYTIKYAKVGDSTWYVTSFTISGEIKEGKFTLKEDESKVSIDGRPYVIIKLVDPTTISTKDNTSVEVQNMLDNRSNSVIGINLTNNTDYLMECIEINLAQEYQVIKFDFYNDWLNGTVYLPRWARNVKYKKKRKKGQTIITEKVKACMNNTAISQVSRRYVQQCSLAYDSNNEITTKVGCHRSKLRCHKANGRDMIEVFGSKGGVVNESRTSLGDSVYYLKPCEFRGSNRVPFFATDIVMLGTLFDCNEYGLPSTFDSLLTTTYQLPPNLAQTNVDDESDTYYNLNVTTQQQNAWGENTTWLAPSVDVIKQWGCNEKCPGNRWNHSGWGGGKGRMVTPYIQISGVTPTMPSYAQLDQYLATFDDSTDKGYGSYVRIIEGDENTVELKGAYIITGGTHDDIDYNQYAWLESHVSVSDIIIFPKAATSGNTYFVPQGSILPPKKYENTAITYVFYKNGFYEWDGGSVDDSEATTELTLAYEDIFPVTELSGIDWSYKGVGYDGEHGKNNGLGYSDDKLLSPGGHFLGLSCSNAETNIKSCVNLKRACEIGTTLSERLEIPVGYKSGLEADEDLSYDIVNYLYVAPNGLISKDQISDVTFRSAFATMNQNSLRTVVNSYGYKEYDFKYLLPDSFDGSLEKKISEYTYTKHLPQETNSLWNESTFKNLMESHPNLEVDVAFESGNTIVRNSEFESNDYVTFRMGDNKKYLYGGNRMPVYQNSFYFYFGLVNGSTALDIFKSQYYAPCAPQVITTPKGEMTLSVKWSSDDGPNDSNTRNFACDVDVQIRGLEMESVKNYTLTRLYMDDYHIIESEICTDEGELKNNGDFWTITGLRQATGIIQGQVASNNFIISGVPFGTYEVHIQDEQGNEISQELEVGKGLLNVSYSKNSVVGYKTSVGLIEMQTKKGVTDETYSPKDAENGGYINGTFKITATDKSVTRYRVVVKRVSDYDSDANPLNFELVYNGIENYYPVSEWSKWKDGNRLYLWGYGEYEIWVRSIDMKTGTYSCEFKYDTFTVRDGSSLQFTIGDSSYGLGSVSYDTLYNLEKKGSWWTNFMSSTSDLNENERYLLYRTIVDYREFNTNATPHNLNVIASPKDSNVLVLGEAYDGDKKLNKGIISSHGSVVTLTAEDEGLVLGTDNLYHALNETTSADTRSYPLYYTLYTEDGVTENNVWGTKYCEGRIVKEGAYNIFIANTDSMRVYNDFLNNVNNLKMFILEQDGDMMLVSCNKMSNRLYVVLGDEKIILINKGKNIKEGQCKLVHVAKLPYWRNVFKYVGIVQRNKNTNLSSSDVELVSNATNGYKVGIKQETSFKIIVNDNSSLETVSSNDMYNNIVHMFTPKSKEESDSNEFTTTFEDKRNGKFEVKDKDSVDGCDDYLVQISNSKLSTGGNTLHNVLKTIEGNEFEEGEVVSKKNGYTVCQVFVSEKPNINGKVYYILKLS